MNKTTMAAAATVLLAGTVAAHAEVSLYGKVDLGIVQESGGTDGSVLRLSSGVLSPSRLGFKAGFQLSDGLKVSTQLETGLCADSNNNPEGEFCTGGTFMGRVAKLALSGRFGELSAGRQFTPVFLNQDNFDPFGTGLAGQASNLFAATFRTNNSLIYTTPSFGGLTASATYAFGEAPGSSTTGRRFGGSVAYNKGPLQIGAAYDQADVSETDRIKDANIGASYDFGALTLYGMFERVTGRRNYLLGVGVPIGKGTLMASVAQAKDSGDAHDDASQAGVGYVYPINEQLKAYTAYAHISNKNGARYTVGNSTDTGTGDSAFNVGLTLSF
jgi:predicted porin